MKIDINNYTKIPKDFQENNEEESLKKIHNKKTKEKESKFSKIIKFLKKQKNKIYLNFLIIILFFYSIKFYLLSLEGCQGSRERCLEGPKAMRFFHRLGFYLFLSVLFTSIITILSINNVVFRFYLIIELITYLIMFIVNKGSDLDEHGSYNTMAYILLFPFITFEIEIIFLLIKSIKEKNNKLKYFCIIILIFPFFYYFYQTNKGCKEWEIGLNNIKIENNVKEDKCYIKKPNKCYINLFDGFFNVNIITGLKCKASRKEKKILLSFLPKNLENLTEFAFPNTIKFPFGYNQNPDFLQNNILKSIYDPKNKDATFYSENPEIILKFDKKNIGKIIMKITPNETLIKERREMSKKSKSTIKNILILYIDSISRNHFKRKLPLTSNLIENYLMGKNTKKKKKKITSFQFLKYHNFKAITQKNVIPMFYGKSNSQKSKDIKNIIEYYKENGFITAQSIDLCSLELYDLGKYYENDVNWAKFDHENQALFCDPNYNYPKEYFNPLRGPFSMLKRCLYGKEVNDYVFDYGYEFLKAYKNEKKFLRLGFQEAHESSLELIKYMDLKLIKFIQFFIDNYYQDDSIIFIVSDHGNNMVSLHNLIKSEDYFIEKTLGSLFIFFPDKIFEKYFDDLYYNQQKLITPYDIFFTLNYLIGDYEIGDKNKGQNLFTKINGLERSCDTYFNDFDDKRDCHCINYKL